MLAELTLSFIVATSLLGFLPVSFTHLDAENSILHGQIIEVVGLKG